MNSISSVQAEPEASDQAPLYLAVGEQRAIALPELLRFSVSGDAIRYTRVGSGAGQKLLLKAVKPGISQLETLEGSSLEQASSSTRLIRVELSKPHGHSAALLEALSRLRRLEVIDLGKRFVVRGRVAERLEAQALAELREHHAESVLDETELDPAWLETIRPALQSLVRGSAGLQLEVTETSVTIRGTLPTAEALRNLERRARAVFPLARFEVQTLSDLNPTLYFKIYLLEMKRETLRSIGVKWPTERPFTLRVASFDSPEWMFGGPTQVDLSVQALSQKGQLRILSTPELVVRCPGQAELFAGGELPIRQHSKFNDSVIWKNIGLALKLDAKEYNGERVRLQIETELSHRDESLSNDKIPGVQSNRIKTSVDAAMGRPLFLSGLLQEDVRRNRAGLAGLSEIPILGALFRSEDFQNDRSELVAILVPSREPPAEPITRLGSGLPKGYLPVPRSPVSLEELEELRSQSDFPWNALQ